MKWEYGRDHIYRTTYQNRIAEITLCDMRSRFRFTIYEDGKPMYRSGPYIKHQRAKKAAEDLLVRDSV